MRLLKSHGVEYLLIGGYAVNDYGHHRSTGGMDIWIGLGPGNAERAIRALNAFGFTTPDLTPEMLATPGRMLRMGVVPYRLEVLTELSGVDFTDCYPARNAVLIDGVEVDLIRLEDLRTNKAASGRHKDLVDLDHLP